MQTVILAGGLGTRIRKVSGDLPKSLIPIAGRPFIEHQLELLSDGGIRDVLLCVGFGGERIEEHVGDGAEWGVRARYAHEAPEHLMGTGGALINALPQLAKSFLVMYGDSYLPTNYRAVIAAFKESGARALMCVFRNEGRWDKSNVRIAGDRVDYYSKDAGPGEADCIDYGLSAYTRGVIEEYQEASLPLDLAQIQQYLVASDELAALEVKERFYEIGKPEGLAELEELLGSADG